ncbi:MAG: oxygenase MpaB family protein [Mycobacteriales bacterium]
MSYDGLFDPHSITWRVHGEPVLWVAGIRALLLQALHPAAMAGVLRHSDFRADPWGRLMRTASYVGTVTYGTTETASRAANRVRALHDRANGSDPTTGVHYAASDPELLRWVHCCEVDSFLSTYQRAIGALPREAADCYLAEQVRSAALLGIDPDQVPASVQALEEYFRRMRPCLRVDRRTRALVGYLMVPPMSWRVQLFTPARPAWASVAILAVALLPPWARRLYGLPGLPTTDLAASAAVRGLASLGHALPRKMWEGPQLRQARRRAASPVVPGG